MNENIINIGKDKEKSKKMRIKKVVSLLLAWVSISGNLQQGTYAMERKTIKLKIPLSTIKN